MSSTSETRTAEIVVTADLRAGRWLGRVIESDGSTVFDAEPQKLRAWALHLALCSPAVVQARREGRPVKLRTIEEQEQADAAGEEEL